MSYQSIYREGLFHGQVIIVTGGGSGIGRATAHELSALGATVAIVGRDPEKLEKVKAEIEAEGGSISTHVCDIREEEQVIATIDAVLATHGRMLPDGLERLDSWIAADGDGEGGGAQLCYQLMETDDPALFDGWTARWADLVSFEIHPVVDSATAAARAGQDPGGSNR